MAKRRKGKSTPALESSVKQGHIELPKASRPVADGLGVDQSARSATPSPMRSNARYAGSKSGLFPKGGEAFERWCSDKGISPRERRSQAEWSELLEEFANRPIHGLRRGPAGGNHRANKRDLRR